MTFGPTFYDEMKAAGIPDVITYTGDGRLFGRELLTPAQLTTLDAVIAAHNPNRLRANIILFSIFLSRWLDPEYTLLMQRRATAITAGNITLVRQWDMAMSNGQVDLNSPAAINFKNTIVAAGILTQIRADVIFS